MTAWDVARYEEYASHLLPAAARAVEIAGVSAGDRVLDVACGSGNAAAEAIAAGGQVTGVDVAERLLDVARERTPNATFLTADAAELPFDDATFDVALSVFGIMFAPVDRAVAELLRVVRGGGRVVVTTWVDSGPLFRASEIVEPHRAPSPPPAVRWGDPDAMRALFAPHDVTVHEEGLVVRADSAREAVDSLFDHQPMWVALRDDVGDETYERLRAETTAAYETFDEVGDGFQATAPYLVTEVRV